MFERREQREEKAEVTYYAGLPRQLKDEETTYKKDIPSDLEE